MRNIVREWDADGPGGDNKSVRSKSSRTSRGTKKTANSKGGDSVAPSVSAKGSRMSASDKRSSRSRGASTVVDKNAIDNDAKIYKHIQDAKSKREDEYTVRLCEACARGDMAAVTRLIVDYEINVNRGDYDQRFVAPANMAKGVVAAHAPFLDPDPQLWRLRFHCGAARPAGRHCTWRLARARWR